jgi:hypothetical protein
MHRTGGTVVHLEFSKPSGHLFTLQRIRTDGAALPICISKPAFLPHQGMLHRKRLTPGLRAHLTILDNLVQRMSY